MVAEESLQKATAQVQSLQAQIKKTQQRLVNSEKFLEQTMTIKNELQDRLDKTMALKDTLQKKVNELSQMAEKAALKTDDI